MRNSGSAAVSGWSLEFNLPAGVSVTGHYNGDATVSGRHVTVKNAFYNADVPAAQHRAVQLLVHRERADRHADGLHRQRRQVRRPPRRPADRARHPKATAGHGALTVAMSWAAAQGGDTHRGLLRGAQRLGHRGHRDGHLHHPSPA
ncbi:cellulose binding domain-containing protein [Streptomyces echinatus]|uniref:cellulose binding domain-containing protein n=1 Tax=Streptomyces echinatus TaxID=67293 RepID=UPI0031EC4A78